MPTFTTIALENLLEPHARKSFKSADLTEKPLVSDGNPPEVDEVREAQAPKHIYISPALYVTPEPAPIPEGSSGVYSVSPSPYVVNHKRRGGGRSIGGFEIPLPPPSAQEEEEEKRDSKEEDGECLGVEMKDEEFKGVENGNGDICIEEDGDGDGDGDEDENGCFLDPITSSSNRFESQSFVSAQADFFDANEDFSSDGSISTAPSYGPSSELELRAMRLSLLEEIERQKSAEDTLQAMQRQWQRISNLLGQTGLSFPAPPNACGGMDHDITSLEQLAQEVVVARSVAKAVGRGEARAEAELAAEAILESKEQELSRLRDRLQYYEAVNHEMSQRNQEIVEVARRQRQRKQRQRKWLWSCVGLSLAVGASFVAYSYLPSARHEPQPSVSDSVDCSPPRLL